jgi:hypothetical protein
MKVPNRDGGRDAKREGDVVKLVRDAGRLRQSGWWSKVPEIRWARRFRGTLGGIRGVRVVGGGRVTKVRGGCELQEGRERCSEEDYALF